MYKSVFPRCTVSGSVEPVQYSHFISGAVPSKCRHCNYLFEGGCTRAMEQVQGYLSLDHGPCPVKGPTDPVLVETRYYVSKVYVPSKCSSCRHLFLESYGGFVCNFERVKWGDFPRTLDWGSWSPEHPNLGLESGRSVSVEILQAVKEKNEAIAIKAFRAVHSDATFKEAREAFAELTAKLHKSSD